MKFNLLIIVVACFVNALIPMLWVDAAPMQVRVPQQVQGSQFAEGQISLAQLLHKHAKLASQAHLTTLARSMGISADLIGVGISGRRFVEGGGIYSLTDASNIEMLAKLDPISQDLNEARLDTQYIVDALDVEDEEASRLKLLYTFFWNSNHLLSPSVTSEVDVVMDTYQHTLPNFAEQLQEVRALTALTMEESEGEIQPPLAHDLAHDNSSFLQRIFSLLSGKAKTTTPTVDVAEQKQQNPEEQLSAAKEKLVDVWLQELSQVLGLELHFTALSHEDKHYELYMPEILGIIQARVNTDAARDKEQLAAETDSIIKLAKVVQFVQHRVADGQALTAAEVQETTTIDGDSKALNQYILTWAFVLALTKTLPDSSYLSSQVLEVVERLLDEYRQIFSDSQLMEMREAVRISRHWNESRSRILGDQPQ